MRHPVGRIAARVPLDGASDVAISRDGVVYVARLGAGLARADLPAFDIVPIATDGTVASVAFGPMGATAFVAGLGGPMALVDVATNAIVAVAGAGRVIGTPFTCAASVDGRTAVLGVGGAAYTFDVEARALSASIPIRGGVDHVAVHPAAALFYATANGAGELMEVDIQTRAIVRAFVLGGAPRASLVSRDGATLYVANDGHVDVLSLASTDVVHVALGTRGAYGLAVSPDDARLYVTSTWAGAVHIIDIASRAVIDAIAVGGEPRGIAVSEDGRTVAVANEGGWVDFIQ